MKKILNISPLGIITVLLLVVLFVMQTPIAQASTPKHVTLLQYFEGGIDSSSYSPDTTIKAEDYPNNPECDNPPWGYGPLLGYYPAGYNAVSDVQNIQFTVTINGSAQVFPYTDLDYSETCGSSDTPTNCDLGLYECLRSGTLSFTSPSLPGNYYAVFTAVDKVTSKVLDTASIPFTVIGNTYPILTVGPINAQNVASLQTKSNLAWYDKLFKDSVAIIRSVFSSIALAFSGVQAGEPAQFTTTVTNGGAAAATSFTNAYFVSENTNSNFTALSTGSNPFSSIKKLAADDPFMSKWDFSPVTSTNVPVFSIPTLGAGATLPQSWTLASPGLPMGSNLVMFCADIYGQVSDPATALSSRCSPWTVSNVDPAPTSSSPAGTLSASSCIIPAGSNTCNTTITWTTASPVGTSSVTSPEDNSGNSSSNFHVSKPDANNGSQSNVAIFYPSRDFYLYNNNILLARSTATATCATGTTWNSSSGTCVGPDNGSMYGTLTPSITFCVITSGNNCTVNLNWSINNPEVVPASITANGMSNINLTSTLNTPQSGTKTITVTSPGTTFYLYDNSILLATSVVSASTSGAWGLGNCVANSGSCGAGTESAVCSDSINGCAGNPPSPQDCTVQCGGACSVPVNHSKPCSMGSVNGKVTSGVSSWKWTCISNGDVSSQCTEYKKKPSYLEN